MQSNQYTVIAALVFTVVAALQLARAVYGWPVIVGSTEIPIAVSWVAAALASVLAIAGFMTARR